MISSTKMLSIFQFLKLFFSKEISGWRIIYSTFSTYFLLTRNLLFAGYITIAFIHTYICVCKIILNLKKILDILRSAKFNFSNWILNNFGIDCFLKKFLICNFVNMKWWRRQFCNITGIIYLTLEYIFKGSKTDDYGNCVRILNVIDISSQITHDVATRF